MQFSIVMLIYQRVTLAQEPQAMKSTMVNEFLPNSWMATSVQNLVLIGRDLKDLIW